MEIPDLNFQKLNNFIVPQTMEFYSVQGSNFDAQSPSKNKQKSYDESFRIIVADVIQKKTMNVTWVQRFFCLTPLRLIYYTNKHKKQVKGCFNLASLTKYKLKIEQQQNILKLVINVSNSQSSNGSRKEILLLNFQNSPDKYIIWKTKLSQTLSKITAYQNMEAPYIKFEDVSSPRQKIQGQNFWNKIVISNKQIFQYSNQLDIVFFRSRKPIASLHRLLMRSRFDHVGLLFKDSYNKLLILQAIESRGVWINQWSKMIPSLHEHYQQIAFKKLITNGKNIDINSLQKYLNMIIGKKYELSLSKLLINSQTQSMHQSPSTNQSTLHTNNSQTDIFKKQKQKTFFCSQLIADIYIKCGLIVGKKRNQFWPRDFEGRQLVLEGNAVLSDLMYLDI